MRKVFREKKFVCQDCGVEFYKRATKCFYCSSCGEKRRIETKVKWYIKENPNAYAVVEKHFCIACGERAVSSFNNEWYCNKHWLRMYNNGTLEKKKHKINNTYEFNNDCYVIITANKDRILVDAEDFSMLKNHSWCKRVAGYAVSRMNNKIVNMHRLIMGNPVGMTIDHINGNKLDNRKSNLRICTHSNNSKNHAVKNKYGISGIRDVPSGYSVRIMVNYKAIYIGTYKTLAEAIEARKNAEIKYYGEFAPSLSQRSL